MHKPVELRYVGISNCRQSDDTTVVLCELQNAKTALQWRGDDGGNSPLYTHRWTFGFSELRRDNVAKAETSNGTVVQRCSRGHPECRIRIKCKAYYNSFDVTENKNTKPFERLDVKFMSHKRVTIINGLCFGAETHYGTKVQIVLENRSATKCWSTLLLLHPLPPTYTCTL